MGFFSKFFGSSPESDPATTELAGVGIAAALSLQLSGEHDQALRSYTKIGETVPDDLLAPFFAASVMADEHPGKAAEQLRDLSRRVADEGGNVSKAVAEQLFTLVSDEPYLTPPAVADLIVLFGDRLKAAGFARESAVCFEIATGLTPDNAHVLHKFGDTLHDLRIYDYAEVMLKKALDLAPNLWDAQYTYAVLLQDQGRFEESLSWYEKATVLNPNHARSRNNYGAALLMTGRFEEALVQCSCSAELDPSFPLSRVNMGTIHLQLRSYEAARSCFTDALALNENLPLAFFGLGSAEDALGTDADRVRGLYRKAIELDPTFPPFHHAMGNLLTREGNIEALAHFAEAQHLSPELPDLQRDYGAACLRFGRREEALEHLQKALQQTPDDTRAQELLARAEAEE